MDSPLVGFILALTASYGILGLIIKGIGIMTGWYDWPE